MSAPIYFARIARKTKTGRNLYKLSDGKGHTFGRAFTIDGQAGGKTKGGKR